MNATIRLVDPGQPARCYAAAGTLRFLKAEARDLGRAVLSGGTIQLFEGYPDQLTGDEDPIAAWVAK